MSPRLKAKVVKTDFDVINLQIRKEDFEAFCSATGLFKKEFLDILDASEKDHKEGRVTERKSLYELVEKK